MSGGLQHKGIVSRERGENQVKWRERTFYRSPILPYTLSFIAPGP